MRLVSGLRGPRPIAVDSDGVYWADFDAIGRVPLGGGEVHVLASDQGTPGNLAVGSHWLYWTGPSRGIVARVPSTGGAINVLASARVRPLGLALQKTTVYWAEGDTDRPASLMKVNASGGIPSLVARGNGAWGFVTAYGNSLYWTGSKEWRITEISADSGSSFDLLPADLQIGEIVVSDRGILAFVAPLPSAVADGRFGTSTSVARIPHGGGAPSILASGLRSPYGIAVDGTYVYWSDSGIWRVPLAGGHVEKIAPAGWPWGIAVYSSAVYWTDFGEGSVYRLTLK